MPFDIAFVRTFKHTPWVDAVDRVAAGGDSGFNVRFKQLETDLDAIRDRFRDVSRALDELAASKVVEASLTVPPLLTTVGGAGWVFSTPGEAEKPAEADTAKGVMALALPPGAAITSFRAFGSAGGTVAKVRVELKRRKFDGTGESNVVTYATTAGNVFPPAKVPQGGPVTVDSASSYYVAATADGEGDRLVLTGFQVNYRLG
ncbi:hypothetical protein [Streptomyces sp. NPDC007369]|uniref:hypothetical protein n=1 Tax=Streptomyces sp. NPDC007369 TaxID=3154589 RepID=UPI0033D707C8